MNNYIYITTMKPHELAAFLRKCIDPDEDPEVACYGCINYGTHHSDPANKGTNLYECDGCPCEGIGLNIEEWLMREHEEAPEDVHAYKFVHRDPVPDKAIIIEEVSE